MNSLQLGAVDLYGRGVHFAKQYLSPTNLDRIEAVGSALFPAALGFLAPSLVMNSGGLNYALSLRAVSWVDLLEDIHITAF